MDNLLPSPVASSKREAYAKPIISDETEHILDCGCDMDKERQSNAAKTFLARHHAPPVLLLPNVWDAMSARIFAAAGFDSLATTSAGVAWALGYPDGEIVPWAEVVGATARIVRAAGVPVTADIERGYGETPEIVGGHVADIIRTGVVGINLEDSLNGSIRSVEDATARLQAARKAALNEGVPIVINARCDIFHRKYRAESTRFDAAIARCRAYLAAGADCVYPFGLRDLGLIAAFTKAISAPINITGRPGMPDTAEFERMGVARITIASAPTLMTMGAIRKLAAGLRSTGSFDLLSGSFDHPDAQKLFQSKG